MEEAGGKGGFVHLELGQDFCHFERMREIGFSGSPLLTLVNLGGENIASTQKVQIRAGMVFLNLFLDVLYPN
jgi:hypothetical protein